MAAEAPDTGDFFDAASGHESRVVDDQIAESFPESGYDPSTGSVLDCDNLSFVGDRMLVDDCHVLFEL